MVVLNCAIDHCDESSNCTNDIMSTLDTVFKVLHKQIENFSIADKYASYYRLYLYQSNTYIFVQFRYLPTYSLVLQVTEKALKIPKLLPAFARWSTEFHKAIICLVSYAYLL